MTKYNYNEEVKNDVMNAILDAFKYEPELLDYTDDKLYEHFSDSLWCDDSVTGNGSGSYTFNRWEAEENLSHNMNLLGEALTEFGCDADYMSKNGAEACDVTIRCYLLGQVLNECIEEAREKVAERISERAVWH